jgi:predicted helicase
VGLVLIHAVLREKVYENWAQIEARLSNVADNGDAFEHFVFFYFLFHKDFYQINDLYSDKIRGKEIPQALKEKYKLSNRDDGVDGLIIYSNGLSAGYQAKFRSKRASPSSNELNNFWSEAEYCDFRLVITNASRLPSDVKKRRSQLTVLVERFDSLPPEFFKQLHDWAIGSNRRPQATKAKPRDYQKDILDAVTEGFAKVDRGKVVAACGIGKTLIALWVSEAVKAKTVLFLAPSLALVRQTLDQWVKHSNKPFAYICVCSPQVPETALYRLKRVL